MVFGWKWWSIKNDLKSFSINCLSLSLRVHRQRFWAEGWPLLLSGAPPAFWAGKIITLNTLKLIWHALTFQITTQPHFNYFACCPLSVCARNTQPCRWYNIPLVYLCQTTGTKSKWNIFSQLWEIFSSLDSWFDFLLENHKCFQAQLKRWRFFSQSLMRLTLPLQRFHTLDCDASIYLTEKMLPW